MKTCRISFSVLIVTLSLLTLDSPLFAQQKGQWVPGQSGLNAGVIPDPGFSYVNMAISYSASQLNGPSGNRLPRVTGTYSFWVDENIFMYVPKFKVLGGNLASFAIVNYASGSLVADFLDIPGARLGGGGSGLADTYVQPIGLAWHFKRADVNVGYGFVAPTGRFTQGASNNVSSGYWGNFITTGTTLYITKNKGTSANLFTGWETHGTKSGTNITPGEAFTIEWGVGQVLPLKKDFSRLLQIGVVGYDQWQVSHSSGTLAVVGGIPIPESRLPFYSVHAIGVQSNFILPTKNLAAFFKYYNEYRALARPEGRTIVFGFSWTFRIPKPAPPKPTA